MDNFEVLNILKRNAEEASRTCNLINIYSVYDTCSKLFGDVFVSINDDVVHRNYANLLNSEDGKYHMYKQRPQSFMLFKLGSYNMFEGIINPELTFLNDFTKYVVQNEGVRND